MTTSPDGVRSQLEKILASPRFVHSERLKRFLRYVVEEGLAGRGENLKEYTLALAVFDKDESHDTSQDPIVRVEARRLRARLKEYYETDGRKDPLRIELPKGSYAPAFLPAAPPSRKTRWRAPAIASTALMAAIGIASFYGFREKPVVPREWVLKRLTADSGLTTHPAISRDGTRVAFASDRGGENNLEIWVQPSAGGDPLRLTHHPSDDYEPAFSPDATRIAFRSDRLGGGIYVVPALGGEVRAVAPYGRNPRFSPDGKWIAYWVGSLGGDLLSPAGRVFIVPANGGAAQPIQPEFPSAVYPVWSPDGRYLLFLGTLDTDTAPERRFDWWTAPVASGRPEKAGLGDLLQRQGLAMLPNGGPPEWTADALLFTARGGDSTNLWQVRFSSSRRRVVGPAARITFGTALEMYPSAALDGRIAFASVTHNSDLWSQPVEPHEGVVAGEMQRLTEGPANEIFPSVSADGNRLAFLSDRSGSLDVWLKDLPSGVETAVAAGGPPKRYPRISPSGSRIVYSEQAGGRSASYLVSAAGGDRETLCEGCSRAWGWSPDEAQILFQLERPPGPLGVGALRLSTRQITPLLQHATWNLANPGFSPDSHWVSFHAILSPVRRQIFVAPVKPGAPVGEEGWLPVTDGQALERNAAWSPDSSLLYWLSERDAFRCIWAQRLDRQAEPQGLPFPVLHLHQARRSLSSGDVGAIGLAAAPGKLIFSASEVTGSVWIARPSK